MTTSWILTEPYAGLQSQAQGLAEAAYLTPELRTFTARFPWRHLAAACWPSPLTSITPPIAAFQCPDLMIGAGGKSAAILAALRGRTRTVIIQHPRMDIGRFDLVAAARHDRLTGPNVLVTRTALHRVTPARLAQAAAIWGPRLAHLPRPLVAVLLGGSNGRHTLDDAVGRTLAAQLAEMMRLDRTGLAMTPSRRTDPRALAAIRGAVQPLGGWVWDGSGDNPYFGLLACADAIIVTIDSVSMISEAVATSVPVLLAALPGRSRRIELFHRDLIQDGRVRPFQGRLDMWPTAPLDDTPAAAAEMRHRLGL